MRERCVLLIVVCQIVAACSTSPGLRAQSGSSAMTYLERDHGVWLAPLEREHMMCSGGQVLICDRGVGRLSQTWCECEALRIPARLEASF